MNVYKSGKILKSGYTTGTCACSAAVAGATYLLKKEKIEFVSVKLPIGKEVVIPVFCEKIKNDESVFYTVKDGGDDPDITTGMKICARVRLTDEDIVLTGGEGIGIAKVDGLRIKNGEYAINPVPRKNILDNLKSVAEKNNYKGGFYVEIFAPEGIERGKKTFNERLGIEGGISILGTTGIVEPMSEKALVETIKLDVDRWISTKGKNILIAPGNYGREYCKEHLGFDLDAAVKISNYVGESLDYISFKECKDVLLVGHMGKLVKLAAGIMNTHSSYADGRMEIIGAYTALAGGNQSTISRILSCTNTDLAIDILKEEELFDKVINFIIERIIYHLNYRYKGNGKVDVIIFGKDNEEIGRSAGADKFLKEFKED